jgi:hypothetical protein
MYPASIATAAGHLGDFLYTIGIRHTLLAGFVHGALLLTTVGAVLGASSGRLIKGLPIGAIAGIGGASLLPAGRGHGPRTYGTAIPAACDHGCCSRHSTVAGCAPDRWSWREVALASDRFWPGARICAGQNRLWGRPRGGRNYLMARNVGVCVGVGLPRPPDTRGEGI